MKATQSVYCALAAGLLSLGAGETAFAAACSAVASSAWNLQTTWGPAGTGCVGAPGGIPGAGDTVSIGVTGTPRAVTVPAGYTAQAASLAIGGTTTNGVSALTLSANTSTLIVGGNVSVSAPNNNNVNALNVNAGSATVNGSITLTQGTTNARISRIAIASGSLTVNGAAGNDGDIVMNNASADSRTQIVVSSTGSITVTRSLVLSNGFGTLSMTLNGSTFTYSSGSAASVATGPAISYKNLTINKTGGTATTLNTPSAPRALTVTGNLQVSAGTLDVNNVTAAVSGTTNVSGTLAITSATGAKTFTGNVTINGSGTWNNSGNAPITMGGGLANNGTFASGAGTYTFGTTAAQDWSGSSAIAFSGSVIVNATRTNNTTTTINGTLTCDAALTNAAGRTLTVGGTLAGKSSLTNSASSTLKVGGDATIATLTATAADNTVEYNGAGAQSVKNTAYYHLTISSGGTASLANDTSVAGNLSDNGQLNALSGNYVVTFNGNVAQSLLGAATNTSFYRLTINNTAALASRKLTASHDITVSNLLTFTSGRIVMSGTAKMVIASGVTVSGATGSPDNRYVAGRLQKVIPNGNPSVTFEVGTDGAAEPAIGYSPVLITFAGVSTGNLIAYATAGDHPQILTSTLDDTQSVNRYWSLDTSGVSGSPIGAFTSYDATFTFVNGVATDVDAGANTALFEVERWDGAAWNVTTFGARTSTSTQALGITATSDFAVAVKKAGGGATGGFNAMDTPTCAVSGVIKTKVAGIATSLNIVALNSTRTALQTNFNGTVRVELMNAFNNAGYPDANGCGPNWAVIQQLADVSFGAADNGCKATSSFTENNAWREARVRITENPGKPSEKIGCSGDNFAIRPQNLTVTAHDATWETAGTARTLANVGASGGNVHKASTAAATTPRPFTLRVTPVPASATNYDGSPAAASGFPACGSLCATVGTLDITPGSWTSAGGGVRENATANYSEAGTFSLQLEDAGFASVDAADGTPDTCSNTSPFGRRACSAASVEIGRFVPDHFIVAPANTPQFQTFGAACAGTRSFTYIGQSFGYAAAPVALVTARNAAGGTTTNYRDSLALWKITTAAPSDVTQAYSNNAVGPSLDLSLATNAPTVSSLNDGTGTVTISASDRISYTRSATTPDAPFNANISLTVAVRDDSEADGEITTSTATPFNAIGFDSGGEFRYGRLALRNASGSQLVPLPLQMETQYWNSASSSFVTNAADNCTTVDAAHIGLANYTGNLNAGETTPTVAGALSGGRKTLVLSAPGSTNSGSVDIVVNLGTTTTIDICPTWSTPPTPAGASLSHLRAKWCGATYSKDPTARARFGAYAGAEEVIFMRESY